MSEQNNIQDLLRQGIEAARSGDKAKARELLQQVVDLDEQNEKGWFWLASVVQTDEERRVCLANVLFINPNNERAQKAMEQIEARSKQKQDAVEVIPGVTRRQLTLIVGGGAVVIVLLLVVVIGVITGRNGQISTQTQEAVQLLQQQTNVANTQVAMMAEQTATIAALVTATDLPSPTPDLPPTWTPSPEPTSLLDATPLPPPEGLFGNIAAWSGVDVRSDGFLPVGYFTLNGGGQFTVVGDAKAIDVRMSADGQRLLYMRRFVTEDTGPEVININGTSPQTIGPGLPIVKLQNPYFCAAANMVSFVAVSTDAPTELRATNPPAQVYLLNLDTNQLQRLTNDEATYSFPAISPDCTRVAAVKSPSSVAGTDEDIVLIDVATLNQTAITTDLNNFIETMVQWSQDGSRIAYAAYQATDPGNNDIVVRNGDGTGLPTVVVRTPGNDIDPVFSPDGQFLAYASNFRGQYDIFIVNLADPTDVRQLTNSEALDFPGGWWSPS